MRTTILLVVSVLALSTITFAYLYLATRSERDRYIGLYSSSEVARNSLVTQLTSPGAQISVENYCVIMRNYLNLAEGVDALKLQYLSYWKDSLQRQNDLEAYNSWKEEFKKYDCEK